MKHLFLFTIALLLTASCKADYPLLDMLKDRDKTLAAVLSYETEENRYLRIRFDSPVMLLEYCFNGERIEAYGGGNELRLKFPHELMYGESATASLTVKKDNGNVTRASIHVEGVNSHLPEMVLNEISTDGTNTSPDRIEIYVKTNGNTAGAVLTTSASGNGISVTLPALDVFFGDIIVVYWDKTPKEKDYDRQSGRTLFISGKAQATLPSRNGLILLKESARGRVMDAFIYCDSSEKEKEDLAYLVESSLWSGDAADSSYITASRVFARYPGAIDTDTADDWFITQPRRSTFGEENIYAPYEGDE